jgi:hypothetical protein
MKEATKRLISNETLQERFIRLENAAKRYAAKNSSEMSPERASRIEKTRFRVSKMAEPPPAKYNKAEKLDHRKRD